MEKYRDDVLEALSSNRYWRLVGRTSTVVGRWFSSGGESYPGEQTIVKRGLTRKGERGTVIHEGIHAGWESSETKAWKAVKCMGRYAEKPEADPETGGGGGGGEIGGGGEWWCEYELEWDCWEEDGETVCGNFRWVRTDEPCEWVEA